MSAVLRLVYTYFMGTTMTRVLSVGGILMCLVSVYVVTYLPQSEHMLAFAVAGQIAFFLGSALMPLTFGRLAQGQGTRLLPGGRVKLLISAMLTVAIVAMPVGLLTPLAYVAGVSSNASDFSRYPQLWAYTVDLGWVIYTSMCILAGWLYLAMWFISSQRNLMGFAKASLIIVILLFAPAREIRELSATTGWNVVQLAVIWTAFGIGFLLWPRYQYRFMRWQLAKSRPGETSASRLTGKEVDLMLGTTTPWVLLASLVVPLLIASRVGSSDQAVWLFFLTISSIAVAGVSSQLAERSRALWLRTNWSRTELFTHVERALWRHNILVLATLETLLVVLGLLADYPPMLFAIGIPALFLGTVSSSYLGLMVTRGLRWSEALLGTCLVMGLMIVALMGASGNVNLPVVLAIEVFLAGLTIGFRFIARQRWARIDWSQCRSAKLTAARAR